MGTHFSLPLRGTHPNSRPMSVVAKRLDGLRCHLVWRYRPRPRRLCVRWWHSSPDKKGHSPHPIFVPCLWWPNDCMDGWRRHLVRSTPWPSHIVLDGDPAPPRKVHSSPPFFRSMFIVATVAHLSYCWALVIFMILLLHTETTITEPIFTDYNS